MKQVYLAGGPEQECGQQRQHHHTELDQTTNEMNSDLCTLFNICFVSSETFSLRNIIHK